MALVKLSTTYEVTMSKVLTRYLAASDSMISVGDIDSRLFHSLGEIPGVTPEADTYYGYAQEVEISADDDTPATRRAIRALVNAYENAVRNIPRDRYTVQQADHVFFIQDGKEEYTGTRFFADRAAAQMEADLLALRDVEISA
jgi:hypothetical protein